MLIDENSLIESALNARLDAYAPYSGFRVGAAVLCDDGRVFTGANVENASYGLSICAERVAIANAVSAGYRRFEMLVIATDSEIPSSPCGACRQVLSEFGPETVVVMVNLAGAIERTKIKELLPLAFTNQQIF
ncbi:MAG: cytidine deaminase [Rubrobacteridae bacterium]|nr:cytidine deaminase [Rubrobacteridae bacterium]